MNLLIVLKEHNGGFTYLHHYLVPEKKNNVLDKLNVESFVGNIARTWYTEEQSYIDRDGAYSFFNGEVTIAVKDWYILSNKELKILSKFL